MLDEATETWASHEPTNGDGAFNIEVKHPFLHLFMAPSEERDLRQWIERWQAGLGTAHRWRVTFGLVGNDVHFATGLIAHEHIETCLQHLTNQVTLILDPVDDRVAHAGRWHTTTVTGNVSSNGDDLEGEAVSYRVGRGVALRAQPTHTGVWLRCVASWADLAENNAQLVRDPSAIRQPDPQPVSAEATDTTDTTTVIVDVPTAGAPVADPGLLFELDQSQIWQWSPTIDVLLSEDHAIVLTSEHPSGRAVMLVQAVEGSP